MANKENKKSIFPQKLWQMVNDRRLDSAIRWTDDGQGFVVFENQLKSLCLGKENKMFHTRQPKSFVRQLHLYGFRKIDKNQFTHQFFQRDKPGLLKNIKRSYKSSPPSSNKENDNSNQGGELNEISFNSINHFDFGYNYSDLYVYPDTFEDTL